MNIKCQGHSLTLVQGHSDSTFSNYFSLETAKPTEAKFQVVLSRDGELNICSKRPGHMINMATSKIFFFGTKRPMPLKVCMQHWVVEYFFALETARSIEAKLYVEPPLVKRMKVSTNG